MSEEKNQEGEKTQAKPEVKPDNNDGGDKPQEIGPIERADALAKKLEEAERRLNEVLPKIEQVIARDILGGKSSAGQKPQSQEERDEEEAKKLVDNYF